MKKLLLFLVLFNFSNHLCAQHNDDIVISYLNSFKKETTPQKKCKECKTDSICRRNNYLTHTGFSELSKQTFAKVIVGTDGLPKEGTASSVAIDEKTSKIGGNVNFAPKKTGRVLANIGLSGSTSNNQLNLFAGNEYQRGFKITGGVNWKVRSSVIYNPDSCYKVVSARNAKFQQLIRKIYDYRNVNTVDLMLRINKTRDSLSLKEITIGSINSIDDVEKIQKRLVEQTDSLLFIATYIRKLPTPKEQQQYLKNFVNDSTTDYRLKNNSEVETIIKAQLGDYDLKNAVTTGYTVHWLNCNYSFANNDYNIFDTSFTNNFTKATKKEAFRESVVNLSYNYARVTKRIMVYAFGGISYGNRYALDDLKLDKDTLVGDPGVYVPELSVKAIDVSKFAETYNKSYNYLMLEAGGFVFFGEKKIIGLELYGAVRAKINVPELIDYKPTYSIRFGPLFSMTKDKGVVSNGTLGLLLQSSEFSPSSGNFDDRFSFAVRLSIPFSNLKTL